MKLTEGERAVARMIRRDDALTALAPPLVLPGKCSKCGGRMWGPDIARGTCTICVELPMDDIRTLAIPTRYRWARLEQPIVPPGWTLERPLIPEQLRRKALSWAIGEHDGPKTALTISCSPTDGSHTGVGKSSLAAAVARHIAEQRKLSITWVHASDLRGDHDDPQVPRDALRRLLRAPLSVLDGLGKELGGAHDVRGWQPARMPVIMEYAARMYENDGGIRITTLDLPGKTLGEVYGLDLVRRFGRINPQSKREENATIIML